MLGQTLTSDVQGGGSYAAAKVHDEVRNDRRLADLRLVRDGVQRTLDAIASLNGWPAPVFAFADTVDLQSERAARDATLVQAGIVRLSEDYLMRTYDFEPGDLLPPAQPSGIPRFSAAQGQQFSAVLHSTPYTTRQQEVENLGDDLLRMELQPLDLDAVRQAIRAARDPQDLRARLAVLLDEQRPDFAETLARASFAAEVLGYVHGEGR